MHTKFQVKIGLIKKNPKSLKKIKTIEAYYLIREAMNRFDYGNILGVDYGGSFGPGADEYDSEACAILDFFESYKGVVTKSNLYRELLRIHKKYFTITGSQKKCALITEHIYNEISRLDLFLTSRRSYNFHFYYKKSYASGWPDQ